MHSTRRFGAAFAALVFILPMAACQTVGAGPEATGIVGDPSIAATETGQPGQTIAAIPAPPGICSAPRLQLAGGPPPPPDRVGDFATGVASNMGRNVARNTANIGAQAVLGQIPGVGGLIAVASAQTAAKETIRTAEDVRGNWTATDGEPTCGCRIELDRSGLFIATNDVKPQGCATPALAQARQWKLETTGFASESLVLLGADGASVLARLDRKGLDYFQGSVGGQPVTIWR